MGEYQYRGFRVRTIFETDWRIKTWPPLKPARATDMVRASRDEGESACRERAAAAIDSFIAKASKRGGKSGGMNRT